MKSKHALLIVLFLLLAIAGCDVGGDDDDDNDNNDSDNDAYYDCDDVGDLAFSDPIFFEPLKCYGEEMFFTTPEQEPYNSNHATVLRSQEELDAILEDFGISCPVDFDRYLVPVVWAADDWERKMCSAAEREFNGAWENVVVATELALKDENLPQEYKRSIHFGLIEASDRDIKFAIFSWGGEVDNP